MLIIFFTIVFIAELIVIAKILSLLKRANDSICEINSQVIEVKPIIKKGLSDAKKGVSGMTSGVDGFSTFVKKKKKDIIIFAIKGTVAIILIFALKKFPNKRCLKFVDNLISIGNFLKII